MWFMHCYDFHDTPAKGKIISPSVTGNSVPLVGRSRRIAADCLGTLTSKVTLVAGDPSATVLGENVTIDPEGSPVTLKVIGPASANPLGEATTNA